MNINKDKVIAITVKVNSNEKIDYDNRISELNNLIEASNGEVVSEVVCNRKFIDKSLYIGKGKAEEIKLLVDMYDADAIVFNNDLSGSQIKNLSNIIDTRIIDRTSLILDIFARRTKSKESKLQVQLAQMEYMLPRLIGFRDYLSREGAGIGTRGLGEQKLELDRRNINKEINRIKKKLEKIENTRKITSKKRVNNNIPIVSLIGYTNAGKSTIGTQITNLYKNKTDKQEVFANKDMLFMTLDTTTRKAVLPNGIEFLIADTVGFIENIPTGLIESFKSTLEEIKYSDCILHIIDSSNENISEQIETTYKILEEMDIKNIPIINVFNKSDIKGSMIYSREFLKEKSISVSAYSDEDMERLLLEIEKSLEFKFVNIELIVPYDEQEIINELRVKGYNFNMEYEDNILIYARILDKDIGIFKRYIKE